MTDPDPRPTVHLAGPGELAAALPQLLGFRPAESLVAVGLRGPDRRAVCLTARVDLPPPQHSASLARDLARSMLTGDPTGVLAVVVSEDDDGAELPHRLLLRELVLALRGHGVPLTDALLVRRGRWWSYDCPDACCAPGAGTPLPAGTSELAAAAVWAGTVVEADRAALAARLTAEGPAVAAMARACDEVGDELATRTAQLGWDAVAEEAWADLLAAVDDAGPARAGRLPDRQVARLAWGLRDTDLRDRALTLALEEHAAAAEALWTELTRRAPAPLDTAPATLLAVSAWLRGDGALANVALDRALAGEPSYTLAGLLRTALDACLPPAAVREVIRGVSGPLDADR
jgi:hypothetical protein